MDYFVTNPGLTVLSAGTILSQEMLEILIDTDGADAVCVEKYTKQRHEEFCNELKTQHQKMRFEYIKTNGWDMWGEYVSDDEHSFEEEKIEMLNWFKNYHREKRQEHYNFMFENCH